MQRSVAARTTRAVRADRSRRSPPAKPSSSRAPPRPRVVAGPGPSPPPPPAARPVAAPAPGPRLAGDQAGGARVIQVVNAIARRVGPPAMRPRLPDPLLAPRAKNSDDQDGNRR